MKLNIYLLTLLTTLGSLQLFAAGSEEELPQPEQAEVNPPVEEEVLPIDKTKEENDFDKRLRAILRKNPEMIWRL